MFLFGSKRITSTVKVVNHHFVSFSSIAESFERVCRTRVSQKTFIPNLLIPDSILQRIIELAQLAPSSFNMQPYKVIVIRSEDAKDAVCRGMIGGNAFTVRNAPVSIVFLADRIPSRLTRKMMDLELKHGTDPGYVSSLPAKVSFLIGPGKVSSNIRRLASHLLSPLKPAPQIHCHQNEIWSIKNTALFAQQLILASTAYGLESQPMEGFDELRLKYQLCIPEEEYSIPLVLSLGYSSQEAKNIAPTKAVSIAKEGLPVKKRFSIQDVTFEDQYGTPPSFISNDV